uniref:Uncharacterized protein n=1 Tax=Candidatus Methanogaster sp. ANME-2c ERB4 TaxID=2759911 RepID=A0A7G9YH48_9EURY|nr:hypothetical protein LNGCCOLK_00009 [Methanosarcinales archaeon ANME-2c ERB4]
MSYISATFCSTYSRGFKSSTVISFTVLRINAGILKFIAAPASHSCYVLAMCLVCAWCVGSEVLKSSISLSNFRSNMSPIRGI